MSKTSATRRLLTCLTRRRTQAAAADEAPRPQIAGIAFGVRVLTDFGPVPVQLLRAGDRIKSSDGSWIRLKALRRVGFDADCLTALPEAAGVVFPAGSLGDGLPVQEMTLAPDQRIASMRGSCTYGAKTATECLGHAGIRRAEDTEAVYFVPVCEGTGAVLAEGVGVSAQASETTRPQSHSAVA